MPQPMPSGGSLRRNSEPYPGDGSNIYFVIFCPFLVSFFLSFQFCLSFFCHFSFGLSFFVIFVCHVSVISVKFSQKYGKYQKLFENDRKMTKNDHASRKMPFVQPAKLSFVWSFFGHVFVIWWRFCNVFVIYFGAIFSKIWKHIKNYSKNDRKNDNASGKAQLLQPAKWQTKWETTTQMTNKMTDKIEMQKKWKNNDRQNWNDKKTWQQKRQKMTT